MEEIWMRTLTSTSSTLSLRSSSASSRATCSSPSDTDRLQHLARVHGFERLPRFVECDLALRGVPLRHGQVRGDAELLRHRRDPREDVLEALPRREHCAAVENDERIGEAVADGATEVLLDQSMRVGRQRLAPVQSAKEEGGEG